MASEKRQRQRRKRMERYGSLETYHQVRRILKAIRRAGGLAREILRDSRAAARAVAIRERYRR